MKIIETKKELVGIAQFTYGCSGMLNRGTPTLMDVSTWAGIHPSSHGRVTGEMIDYLVKTVRLNGRNMVLRPYISYNSADYLEVILPSSFVLNRCPHCNNPI